MVAPPLTFRVGVFQDDTSVLAQCLEYDIAAHKQTLQDSLYQLARLIVGHVAVSLENGVEPFQAITAAPRQFWERFERSRIPLPSEPFPFASEDIARRRVVLPPPEIRVALPAAA